jgi:hypothetical protein
MHQLSAQIQTLAARLTHASRELDALDPAIAERVEPCGRNAPAWHERAEAGLDGTTEDPCCV